MLSRCGWRAALMHAASLHRAIEYCGCVAHLTAQAGLDFYTAVLTCCCDRGRACETQMAIAAARTTRSVQACIGQQGMLIVVRKNVLRVRPVQL